jgi:ApbE superfamily uncharacterized protein (UPF0280 family)
MPNAWHAASASKPVRPGRWNCTFKITHDEYQITDELQYSDFAIQNPLADLEFVILNLNVLFDFLFVIWNFSSMYQPRTYRNWVKNKDLISFNVIVEETDCYISATAHLESKARKSILKYRSILKKYISTHPLFLTTLEPLPVETDAPIIVKAMAEAGETALVGPMAAVAGAIAHFVGEELSRFSPEIIIENGGDIYLRSLKSRLIGIYAGKSPLSGKIGLEIQGKETPLGISTSSGTVGHSLSFGKADAVVVLADTATLSDAAATAIGNLILTDADIPKGIEHAQSTPGVRGIVIIKDEDLGLWGSLKLKRIEVDD